MTSSDNGTPQSVVFINSNVPDPQNLLNGLAPSVEAFVIDLSTGGHPVLPVDTLQRKRSALRVS